MLVVKGDLIIYLIEDIPGATIAGVFCDTYPFAIHGCTVPSPDGRF